MKRENTMTTLNVDWDIFGSGYTLSSVTGAFEQFLSEYRPLTEGVLDLYSEWTDESWSQELRLASPQDQRFRWMVGLYYLELRREEETLEAATSFIQEAPPLDSSTPELASARPDWADNWCFINATGSSVSGTGSSGAKRSNTDQWC